MNNAGECMRRIVLCSFLLCIAFFFPGCGGEFEILLEGPATLYWTEYGRTVNSISTDGSDKRILLHVTNRPYDMAFHAPGERIYWAERSGGNYEIHSARLDGTGETVPYTNNTNHGPTVMAIDQDADILYWNERNGGNNRIWRSALDPFAKVTWENNITDDYTYGFCIDTIHRKSYFTVNDYYQTGSFNVGSGNDGGVYMGDLDTSDNKSRLITGTGPSADSMAFRGIVVDGDGGYCFYAAYIGSLRIIKTDLNLQNGVVWITADGFGIRKLALDINGKKLYWTSEYDNSIYRADSHLKNLGMEKFLQLDDTPTGLVIVP